MIVNNPNFRRRNFKAASRGIGLGDSSINITTMWTPTTGFLSTPGNINTGVNQPAPTPTYIPPTLVPRPACSYDPNPFVANSAECIALLLAAQKSNMGATNLANYNVDLANCLAQFPQPKDCYQRTFGLTPMNATGGVNILTSNPVNLLTGSGISTNIPTIPKTTPIPTIPAINKIPTQPQGIQTIQLTNAGDNVGGSGPSDIINTLESSTINLLGYNIPYWVIGLLGVGGLALALGGKH